MAGNSGSRRAWILGGAASGAAALGAAVAANWDRIPRNVLRQYWAEMGRPVRKPAQRPEPRHWPNRGIQAAWLGHTTVLLRIDGFTILTDPVFSTRIGLGFGPITVGLKRLVAPALTLEQLPPVDLVLLSHAHMDHFDIPSLRDLEGKHVEVVTARSTSDLLRPDRYKRVREAGWGEKLRVGPVTIHALKVNHWGARMRTDTWRGYNGYLIQSGPHSILFAGDTAITDSFQSLPGPGRVSLAIMPIGAYNPWRHYHCTPEEAALMTGHARADVILPVHHQTFSLGREPFLEPIQRLQEAAVRDAFSIAVHHIGQQWTA